MKALFLISLFLFSSTLSAKEVFTEQQIQLNQDQITYKKLIPDKYTLYEVTHGDLNKDGKNDLVLIVKATDPKMWVTNSFDTKVDRNRRGVIVYLNKGETYQKVMQNLGCFSSENEEGGVYFPPEFYTSIEKGLLKFNYAHGRYGYWNYTFRLEENDFQLIGYDLFENHGPYTDYVTSINFLNQKKLLKENINLIDRDKPERFKESWSRINIAPIFLSKIKDFDDLDFS